MQGSSLKAIGTVRSVKTSKTVYLPGLNGLRAIAALAVVISHTTHGLGDFGLNNKVFGTDPNGNPKGLVLAGYGVTIFFTLSGFLITFLLLKEKEIGKIRIRDFYIRRILRIWPLYYFYFFLCIVTILIYSLTLTKSSIPFYIFLAANIPFILNKPLLFLGHYWSLGVEEQFYLFFPQLAKQLNKKLLRMAVVFTFILLVLKFVFWVLYRRYGLELPFVAISVTRFHTMLIGVVAAILYYYKNQRFLSLTTHRISQIGAWACIFLLAINKFHIASVIDDEVVSLISVALIMGQVTKRNSLINLENKVCDFIGKISYGIYVLHPLLIFYFAKLFGHFTDTFSSYLLVYGIIIISTILLAYFSYQYFEKRFLRLKAKYARINSVNTRTEIGNGRAVVRGGEF